MAGARHGSVPARVIGAGLIGLIWAYRLLLAPLFPTSCRFLPTCSAYGIEAIRVRGPLWGTWLILRRLVRCHPWGGKGYDPVPARHDEHDCNTGAGRRWRVRLTH